MRPILSARSIPAFCLSFLLAFLGWSTPGHAEKAPLAADAQPVKSLKGAPATDSAIADSADDDLQEIIEEYNAEAVRMFEDGRYIKAQNLWKKAIDFSEHPEKARRRYAVSEDEGIAPEDVENQDLQDRYDTAIKLFEERAYPEAKAMFEAIDQEEPDYEDTPSYLSVLNQILQAQQPIAPEGPTATPAQDQEAERTYQKAVAAYNQSRWEEAKSAFEGVRILAPGYKKTDEYLANIEQEIHKTQDQKRRNAELTKQREDAEFRRTIQEKEMRYLQELEAQTQPLYAQAVGFYKNGDFEKAKAGFLKVQMVFPDYEKTDEYLKRIDADILETKRRQLERKLKLEAAANEGEEAEFDRTLEASEDTRRQEVSQEAEALYQKGRASFLEGDLKRAKFYFSEVQKAYPHYKSSGKYLARIEQDTSREERRLLEDAHRKLLLQHLQEEAGLKMKYETPASEPDSQTRIQADTYYQEAKGLYKTREFAKAKKLFEKTVQLIPGYKSSEKFLARIDEDIKNEEQFENARKRREAERKLIEDKLPVYTPESAVAAFGWLDRAKKARLQETLAKVKKDQREMLQEKAEDLYNQGRTYFKDHMWEMARDRFREVQRISSGYKSTQKYLTRIDREMKREEERQRQRKNKDVRVQVLAQTQEPRLSVHDKAVDQDTIAVLYKEAILLFKHEHFWEAKEKFAQVRDAVADYKSTDKYLRRIDYELKKEHRRKLEKEYRDFAQRAKSGESVSTSASSQRPAEVSSRSGQESSPEGGAFVRRKEEKRRKEKSEQAQETYEEALHAYYAHDYKTAKAKWIDLEAFWPGYKETRQYLSHIDEDIAQIYQNRGAVAAKPVVLAGRASKGIGKDQVQQKAQELFGRAQKLYIDHQLEDARSMFLEVQRLVPGHRGARKYVSRIDRELKQQGRQARELEEKAVEQKKRQEAKTRKELKATVTRLYKDAVYAYKYGKFDEADQEISEINDTLAREELEASYREQMTQRVAQLADGIEEKRTQTQREADVREERERNESAQAQAKEEKEMAARQKADFKNQSAREVKESAQGLYREAVDAYKKGNLDLAGRKISDLEGLLKDPRMVASYAKHLSVKVARLQEGIARKEERARQDVAASQSNMETTMGSGRKLPNEFDQQKRQLQQAKAHIETALEAKLNEIYQRAVALYQAGSLYNAYTLFARIDRVQPAYKQTQEYLNMLKQYLSVPVGTPAAASPTAGDRKKSSKQDLIGNALDTAGHGF